MTMKEKIIADLGVNYKASDDGVLVELIANISDLAKEVTNRNSIDDLEFEIKETVKSLYLQRGSEDVVTLNESGRTSTYLDTIKKFKRDLTLKRRIR